MAAARKLKPVQRKRGVTKRARDLNVDRAVKLVRNLLESMHVVGADIARLNQFRSGARSTADYIIENVGHLVADNCKDLCCLRDALRYII